MGNLLDYIKAHITGTSNRKIPIESGWPGGDITADMGTGEVDRADDTFNPAPSLKDKVAGGVNGSGSGPNTGAGPSPAFTEDPNKELTAPDGQKIGVVPSQSDPATQRKPGGSLKDKILKSALAVAPVALGGIFGGAAGATGAGEGELAMTQQNTENELAAAKTQSETQNRLMQRMQEQDRYNEQVVRDKNTNENQDQTNKRLIDAMNAPPKPSDEEQAYTQDKQPGETRTAFHQRYGEAGRAKPNTPGTKMVGADGQLLDIQPGGTVPKGAKTPAQFGAPTPEGPHAVMVTPDGKVIDAKPGMTLPTGSQTPSAISSGNAATVKNDKGVMDDVTFATNYLASGKFSGSSDEALLERFFDLTKPSTGFRMNKPQQDLLFASRSWLDSASARFRHATSGTWFSDDQRKQIIQTMLDVASANGVDIGGTGTGLAPGNAAPGQGGAGTRGGARPPAPPAASTKTLSPTEWLAQRNKGRGGATNAPR